MRLGPQTEIKSFLQKFVADHDLKAAFVVMCCGSVCKATIRYAHGTDGINKIVSKDIKLLFLRGTKWKWDKH